jgi:hypothetical protein
MFNITVTWLEFLFQVALNLQLSLQRSAAFISFNVPTWKCRPFFICSPLLLHLYPLSPKANSTMPSLNIYTTIPTKVGKLYL